MGIALDLLNREDKVSDKVYAKECLTTDEKVIDSRLAERAPASRGEMKTQFAKIRFKKIRRAASGSACPRGNLWCRVRARGQIFRTGQQ